MAKVLGQRVRIIKTSRYQDTKVGEEGFATYVSGWNSSNYDVHMVTGSTIRHTEVPRKHFEVIDPQEDNRIEGQVGVLLKEFRSWPKDTLVVIKGLTSSGRMRFKIKETGDDKSRTYSMDRSYIKIRDQNVSGPSKTTIEEQMIGKIVKVIHNHDDLLAGSEGVIMAKEKGVDNTYAVLLTKEVWSRSSIGRGHNCSDPILFPNENGYWVPMHKMEITGDKNEINTDLEFACAMMPWEVEELKKKNN